MVQCTIHAIQLKGFLKCLKIIDICLSTWQKIFKIEINRDMEALLCNSPKLKSCSIFE